MINKIFKNNISFYLLSLLLAPFLLIVSNNVSAQNNRQQMTYDQSTLANQPMNHMANKGLDSNIQLAHFGKNDDMLGMFRDLDLTAEQEDQINQIMRQQMEQNMAGSGNRSMMSGLDGFKNKETITEDDVTDLLNTMRTQLTVMSSHFIGIASQIHQVLEPEQREKAGALIDKRFQGFNAQLDDNRQKRGNRRWWSRLFFWRNNKFTDEQQSTIQELQSKLSQLKENSAIIDAKESFTNAFRADNFNAELALSKILSAVDTIVMEAQNLSPEMVQLFNSLDSSQKQRFNKSWRRGMGGQDRMNRGRRNGNNNS